MKKIAGIIAALISCTAISQVYAEFIPATYFTNCKLERNNDVPNGNNTHVLSDNVAWNTSTTWFFEQTVDGKLVNERYFEAYLHQTALVDSISLWSVNNAWNTQYQTIKKIKIKYFDADEQEWKWVNGGEEFELNYTFDAGMNVNRSDVSLPEKVETYRLRIYMTERTPEGFGNMRLDEFQVYGTPVENKKYNNRNLLYHAVVSSTDNDEGIVERIADGKMDAQKEKSAEGIIGTEEKPYHIVFDFQDKQYTWNSFDLFTEYMNQSITKMKLQYAIADHWVDAENFEYDISETNPAAMGTLENPIILHSDLKTPITSNKFRLEITGCKSANYFRIGELIANGEAAKASDWIINLDEKMKKTAEGEFLICRGVSRFIPKALIIQSASAGEAEIGYFEDQQFVPMVQNVQLSTGENVLVLDSQAVKNNIAVKYENVSDCTVTVYGNDEYAALDEKLATFKTERKYSEYAALQLEIEKISETETRDYYKQKLEEILADVITSQHLTVSNFDAGKRNFQLDAEVYGADQSQVTVLIKAPSGAEDTQTLTLADGKLTGTLPITSAENGTYTITVKAFSKDLTATLETRAVYEGTDIKTFSLDGTNGTVSGTSIKVTLPAGSTKKDRVPSFTLSDGAKLYFGEEELKSGETKIDFTNDVKLKVVAENGTEKTYTVSVTIASSGTGGGGGGGSSSGRGNGSTSKTPTLVVPTEIKTPDKKDIFSDVPSSHWANKAITKLYENKVVSGVSETEFDPDRNVTREEFIVMLLRAKGIFAADHKSGFADAAEHWSSKYVAAAFEAGIVSGIDSEHFGIGMNMTREDACVVLFRSLGETSEDAADFSDADEISDYAKAAVGAMQKKGYVSGFDNAFMPKKHITRAEAAQMIANVYFKN